MRNSNLEDFKASRGLKGMLAEIQISLSFRRKTTVTQKNPDRLVPKVASYILQVRRMQLNHHNQPCDIIPMDGTPVCSDMVAD